LTWIFSLEVKCVREIYQRQPAFIADEIKSNSLFLGVNFIFSQCL